MQQRIRGDPNCNTFGYYSKTNNRLSKGENIYENYYYSK